MIKTPHLSSFLAVCVISVLCVGCFGCGGAANNTPKPNTNTPALATATPDPCAKKTDKELMTELYDAMSGMGSQRGHINTSSKGRVVIIRGWADNPNDKQKAIDIVKANGCVISYTYEYLYDDEPANGVPPGGPVRRGANGCVPPTFQCRDMCLPPDQSCSTTVITAADGTPTPQASPKPTRQP